MIQFYGGTNTGNRKHNEDCYTANNELGLGLVADGMGGYACGEVASALVKETLIDALIHQQGLSEAIVRAHYLIRAESERDESKKGMGSTVVAAKAQGNEYEIAWVGDSRAYIWDGALKQITRDHSYVETLLSTGVIDIAEARHHPNRNLITQAVGVAGEEGLEVSVVRGRLAAGQQLLLCSDGLVDEVIDADIAHIIAASDDSKTLVDTLVSTAFEAGGRDNITVVIAEADAALTDNCEAIEPFVVCTTDLEGRSERHPLPEDMPADLETGVSINTEAAVDIDSDEVAESRDYRWLAVAVAIVVVLAAIQIW